MAIYRALHGICANGSVDPVSGNANWPLIPPGTYFSDSAEDVYPQMVPQGWVPPAAVDPLDTPAVQAFWNVGPQQLPGPIRVSAPATYWTPYLAGGGTRPMILTGKGAVLGFRNWTDTRGAAP
jgi:hypothetical protein